MTFDMGLSPEEFLRLVAGDICPCGHEHEKHEPGQGKDFPVGDFEEVRGACKIDGCECRGELR